MLRSILEGVAQAVALGRGGRAGVRRPDARRRAARRRRHPRPGLPAAARRRVRPDPGRHGRSGLRGRRRRAARRRPGEQPASARAHGGRDACSPPRWSCSPAAGREWWTWRRPGRAHEDRDRLGPRGLPAEGDPPAVAARQRPRGDRPRHLQRGPRRLPALRRPGRAGGRPRRGRPRASRCAGAVRASAWRPTRCRACAAASSATSQDAEITRRHNDANVACFGERFTEPDAAVAALQVFLETGLRRAAGTRAASRSWPDSTRPTGRATFSLGPAG